MNWLKTEIGFDGWRFDFVRGYAPSITKIYMEKTSPNFAVGENWNSLSIGQDGKPNFNQDGARGELVNWVESAGGAVNAFDFTTKGILQVAVQGELWRLKDSNGKPPGMIGVKPENAVTFIDNHDTGSTQHLWPFPSNKVMQGYAYILTHPGTPTIVLNFSNPLTSFQYFLDLIALFVLRYYNCATLVLQVLYYCAILIPTYYDCNNWDTWDQNHTIVILGPKSRNWNLNDQNRTIVIIRTKIALLVLIMVSLLEEVICYFLH